MKKALALAAIASIMFCSHRSSAAPAQMSPPARVLEGRGLVTGAVTPLLPAAAAVYRVARTAQRPRVGGDGTAWREVPAMVLDKKEQTRGGWNGPADLSGSLRLLWDDTALYFHLEVTDDSHQVPNADTDWWQNDACQFAFDPHLNGPKGGYDDDEHSYLAGDSPRGAMLAAYRRPGAGHEREARLAGHPIVQVVRPNGVRVFEWALAWRDLEPLSPWLLGRCGFSWCLNDNDGHGFKATAVWAPGIMYGQDASRFGQLIFDGALGRQPALLGLRPEFKLSGKETTSRWMELPRVAPFGQARCLVRVPQAGPVEARVTIFRYGESRPLARGVARLTVPAHRTAAFTWDTGWLPNGRYEVSYDSPQVPAGPTMRLAFFQLKLDRLCVLKTQLRARYGLDRPWDAMLAAPPLVRRHRGMVAVALQLLEEGDWTHPPAGSEPTADYIEALSNAAAMVEALQAGRDFLGSQRDMFWSAYYSPSDGSGQPFVTCLPANFDPRHTYPLIIHLHGAGGVPTPASSGMHAGMSYLEVLPWGRGSNGYAALGENDVLDVIGYMKQWYRIDPDRVYLTGASMGGRGDWRLASRHADIFAAAAPVCGYAQDLPLDNLRHVPIFNQHGDKDWSVPIDLSRFGVSRLQQLGYPVVFRELPDSPHSPVGLYPERDWILRLRRPQRPASLTLVCDTPSDGRSYWLRVEEFVDPHLTARLTAHLVGHGAQQTLSLSASNVAVVALDTNAMPVDRQHGLLLQAGFQFLHIKGPLPARLMLLYKDGKWSTGAWPPARAAGNTLAAPRPYRAGAAANLYSSNEPLMIVYGTGGDAPLTKLLQETAATLARWSGGSLMPMGHFPVKADAAVTADDLAHFNLIVLGGARTNSLAGRLLPRLPLQIDRGNRLLAGNRDPLSLEGSLLRLFCYNPLAPRRFIYWLGLDDSGPAAHALLKEPYYQIAGGNGANRGSQPDLCVVALSDGAVRRAQQFTTGWQWRSFPDAVRQAPSTATQRQLAVSRLSLLRGLTGADFALDEYEVGEARRVYDPAVCTLADLAAFITGTQTLTATMNGQELLDVQKRWVTTGGVLITPELPSNLEMARSYRVVMPPYMTWKLLERERNLTNVEAGLEVTTQQVVAALAASAS